MIIKAKTDLGSAKGMWDYLFGDDLDENPPNFEVLGKGSQRYGIDTLGWELFRSIHEGETPDGFKNIPTQNGKHVGGIGLTYSQAKWFSALMAVSDEETRTKLQQIHDDVVRESFQRLESQSLMCKTSKAKPSECDRKTKQQGSQTERVPGELIGFLAKHHTARPTQETEETGRGPDPHTHTHIWIANMAFVPDAKNPHGGKWRAIDGDDMNRRLMQFSAECTSEIARRVEDLGFKVDYTQNKHGRWRTEMPILKDLCQFWSSNSRRKEQVIEQFIQKQIDNGEQKPRPPTEDELTQFMAWTRLNKNKLAESRMDWAATLQSAVDAGIKIPKISKMKIFSRKPVDQRKAELLSRVLEANGLTGDDAVFNRRKINKTVALCAVGLGLTVAEQDEFRVELMEHLELIDPSEMEDHKKKWTTKKNLSDEWTISRELDRMSKETHPTVTADALEWAIEHFKKQGITLDAEQLAVAKKVLEPNGLLFIEGYAGSGKTTLLKIVCAALRFQDVKNRAFPTADKIIAISTARDTALRTGDKLEADHKDSIESFLDAVGTRKIRPTKRTVIFVDESVMVDNARMARFIKAKGDAKVVFIGDREQLQCIGAGGWYADAVKKYGVETLTKVHRQKNEEDIAALFNLRNGNAEATLDSLQQRGRLHFSESSAHRMGDAIGTYFEFLDNGRKPEDVRIVFDGKNTDIDTINRIIQKELKRRKLLKGKGFEMADEPNMRKWEVFNGDQVSFIAGYYDDNDPTNIINITNGTKAQVTDINHRKGMVALTSDRWEGERWIKPTAEFTPSYGVHSMRLQGGEAPIILAMPGCGTTNQQAGYSQTSRCIEEVHVFLDNETHGGDENDKDPLEMLKKRWSDSQQKVSARTRMKQAHAMNAAKIAKQLAEDEKRHQKQRSQCMSKGLV